MARFGEVVTAMVTPFSAGGELDLNGAATLARWLVDNGSDALVLAGTTGESPVLSDSETLALTRKVREAVDVPVIVGVGGNDTRHVVELTRQVSDTGVDGLLAVTPYYNRPSQAGIEAHFRACAAATKLPVLLYDIPVRTGRRIAPEVLVTLAREVDNIVGVKDATGDPAGAARLLRDAPTGFELYSGNDGDTLPLLAVGAVGAVSVASHWVGRQMKEMIGAFKEGKVPEARRMNAALVESYDYEASDEAPNPVPTKAMMRVLGLPVGECRPPMGVAPAGLEDRAREVLARLR